jgi:hypothetical protein
VTTRPNLATVLRALNLREPDPVRTASAAESFARLFAWLAYDGRRRRTIEFWQVASGAWSVRLREDFSEAAFSTQPDPIDALNKALFVVEVADALAAEGQ